MVGDITIIITEQGKRRITGEPRLKKSCQARRLFPATYSNYKEYSQFPTPFFPKTRVIRRPKPNTLLIGNLAFYLLIFLAYFLQSIIERLFIRFNVKTKTAVRQ
jgi:hypothetical protein